MCIRDSHHSPDHSGVGVDEGRPVGYPCVVDQHIDATEPVHDGSDRGFTCHGVGEVTYNRFGAGKLVGDGGEAFGVDVDEYESSAVASKTPGDGAPKSPRGTGHDDDGIGQITSGHGAPRGRWRTSLGSSSAVRTRTPL